MMIYRVKKQLTGKELSANTIASFMQAQGVSSPDTLRANLAMRKDVLVFLNNPKMLSYWKSNGWITIEGDAVRLTNEGITKVQKRLSGEDGAYSVDKHMVLHALKVIRGVTHPDDEMKSFEE
jgi:hypothetical protein